MTKIIKTFDQIVEAMGGVREFATIVGASTQHVANARRANQEVLPAAWRLPVYVVAQERELRIHPKLLALEPR